MRDTPRKPPPWRKIAAALRDFFKPKAKQLTEAEERRIVDEYRARLPEAVAVYKGLMVQANEAPRRELLQAAPADTIEKFVVQRAPAGADRQPLVARVRRELPDLLAEAWSPNPAPPPAITELPVAFPAGTKFFDVEGVPVTRAPESWICRAWDKPEPRFFPAPSVLRKGELISEARFRQMVARCDPAFAAFLAHATEPVEPG